MDSRNNETEGLTRLTRQDTVLLDKNFNIGLYNVLQEIYRKFDRVSSIKRTSLYFKSRAKPAIETTLLYHTIHQISGRPPNYSIARPGFNSTKFTKIQYHHNLFIKIIEFL